MLANWCASTLEGWVGGCQARQKGLDRLDPADARSGSTIRKRPGEGAQTGRNDAARGDVREARDDLATHQQGCSEPAGEARGGATGIAGRFRTLTGPAGSRDLFLCSLVGPGGLRRDGACG
jgi:hypothetical protein